MVEVSEVTAPLWLD